MSSVPSSQDVAAHLLLSSISQRVLGQRVPHLIRDMPVLTIRLWYIGVVPIQAIL